MKKNLGFSLMDLIVAMVIVAILSLMSVPVYREYVKKAVAYEGNSLLAEVNAAQQIYYSRNGKYFTGGTSDPDALSKALGISTDRLKYFKSLSISGLGDPVTAFTASITSSEGHNMSLTGSYNSTKAGESAIKDNTTY